jgi:hypothetical protein
MAYSDYGAFVWRNGFRQYHLEDADVDTKYWKVGIAHGLIKDEHILVICYKQGLPKIFYDDKQLIYYDKEKIDEYDFEDFSFDYNGYHFYFHSGYNTKPYRVTVETPNGDTWSCEYDYHYGAGFEP